MRTTVVIDDYVFRVAKQRAEQMQLTLSEYITLALRQAIQEPTSMVGEPTAAWPVWGNPSQPASRTAADFHAAEEELDLERVRGR